MSPTVLRANHYADHGAKCSEGRTERPNGVCFVLSAPSTLTKYQVICFLNGWDWASQKEQGKHKRRLKEPATPPPKHTHITTRWKGGGRDTGSDWFSCSSKVDPSGGLDNVRERGRETERIEVTEKERKSKRMAANTNKTVCPTQVSNKPFFFLFHSFSLLAFHFSIIPLLNYTRISSFWQESKWNLSTCWEKVESVRGDNRDRQGFKSGGHGWRVREGVQKKN